METSLAVANARYRARIKTFELECLHCGTPFTATTARDAPDRKFCSHQCKSRASFAKKYAAGGGRRHGYVGGKKRLAVFERDGWRCQICGAVVDRSLRFPSPGSVTVDHRIPLGSGGPHEPSNWQTAHLACNVEKGAHERLAS